MTGLSDEALRAIAHPARRAMLRLVWDAERPASELADAAGLTRPMASQHLKQLREAGLVTVRAAANRRLYRADVARVAEVAAFLDEFWAGPLQRLRAAAEADTAANTELTTEASTGTSTEVATEANTEANTEARSVPRRDEGVS